jgi:hypothetical protein
MAKVISIILAFCDVETISKILARCISILLKLASKRGGKTWDTAKKVVSETEAWANLFNRVYEDDTMSQEEEILVADAIAKRTPVDKVVALLEKAAKEAKDEAKAE